MSRIPDFMRAPPRAAALLREAPEPANEPAALPPLSATGIDVPLTAILPLVEVPDRPAFFPGAHRGMPAADYFAVEAMSQSGAKSILRSPMHFRVERDRPSEPTAAMQFGTAVHDGILEPAEFAARVVEAPEINRRTKDGRQEWADFKAANAGRIVLDTEDFARARRCIDAVRSHRMARKLLEAATDVELSLFWIDGEFGVPCKARLDALPLGGILDVKTTTDASPEEFSRSIHAFGYHIQGGHYFSGCEHVLSRTPEFFALVAVESEEPHAVKCYDLEPVAIKFGQARMREALERYRDALAAGRWPGYPDTIDVISLPPWAMRVHNR